MKIINVVGAAILKDNKILVSKRKEDKILGNLWEFPGGKVEIGETPKMALKREIREEFHDEVIIGNQIGEAVNFTYQFGTVNLTVFFARLKSNNLDLTVHSKVKWSIKEDLIKFNWAQADKPVVDALLKIDLQKVFFNENG